MVAQTVFFAVFRLIHLLSVIVLIGGGVALSLILMPALKGQAGAVQEQVQAAVRRRYAMIQLAAIALLLSSGLINFFRAYTVPPHPPLSYDVVFGIKQILAFMLFVLIVVVGLSPAQAFGPRRRFWTALNINLGILIVICSVMLRFLGGK